MTLLKPMLRFVKLCCVTLLLALTLLVTGCALNSPTPPAELPQLPPAPALTQPLPSESYLEAAQRNISAWQKKLIDIVPTSKN
jgi:hypothetical protein